MVGLGRGVLQAGANIRRLKERIVGQNFGLARPARQHVEHVLHAQTVSANAGSPAALVGFEEYTGTRYLFPTYSHLPVAAATAHRA